MSVVDFSSSILDKALICGSPRRNVPDSFDNAMVLGELARHNILFVLYFLVTLQSKIEMQ